MSISVNKENIKHFVEEICARSPRYAGTEGEAKAREYLALTARTYGIEVEMEEFEYLHHWPKSSTIETLAPTQDVFDNLPMCYAGSGVAEGEVVYAGAGTKEEFELLDKLGVEINGKIVLATTFYTYGAYPLAQQYGAKGFVVITDAPYDLSRAALATPDHKPGRIPAVLVPAPAGRKILMLANSGKLKLRITLDGEFSKKTSANIVMTVPGKAVPDEKVVLTAHYDSHNLGKHAYDDAAGCAVNLELMRVFGQLKPARTIKAILCGVEELGFWGSYAYVDKHADELPCIKAVLTSDALMGSPYDFNLELRATNELRNFVSNVVKELGHDIKCEADPQPFSDNFPFQSKGVPAIWLQGENRSIFFHTAKDDPETIDYDKLKLWADINGEIAYRVANEKS